MYKVSSDKKQRALHHGKPNDWVNGQEQLKPEEHLQLLKAGLKVLEDRITKAGEVERRELGREKQKLQAEITAFRAGNGLLRKRHSTEGINSIFVEVARAMLSSVQFEMVWNATLREFALGKSRLTPQDITELKSKLR